MTRISVGRQVRLLLALGMRRWFNRLSGGMAAKRSAKNDRSANADGTTPPRPPTARRRATVGLILLLAVGAWLMQVVFFSWQFCDHAIAVAEDRPTISARVWALAKAMPHSLGSYWEQAVRSELGNDSALAALPAAERERTLAAAVRVLAHDGAEDPAIQQHVASLAAALLALIALSVVAMSLSLGNTDLARPDWDELWLAALPASHQALFTARLLQYALLNLMVWLLVPAIVAVLAVRFGMHWLPALGLGLITGAAWAMTAAALRLLIETWLRQRLAHARIKNLQAVLTVVGMGTMVATYAVMLAQGPLPGWFVNVAHALPWAELPTGWAARAAILSGEARWWWPIEMLVAALIGFIAVQRCAFWSRGGLIVHDGTLAGQRLSPTGTGRAWRSMQVLGKDLTLLRRDRALLVQALVMPLFMVGLQLTVNPHLSHAAFSGFHAATTFAVALGGWVLTSALSALAFEGQALWILAVAPLPLAHAIRGKVVMWAAFATGYAALALVVIALLLPWPGAQAFGDFAMILAGLPLMAAVAVGLGAAATDPQATSANRRVGVATVYLYMLVLSLFSLAVHQGGAHERLAILIILAVIAWALWQRLRDRLAYIFEPIDAPPRQVDLADGAWAAFAFLVLQGLCGAILLAAGSTAPVAITVAFGCAGGLTAVGTLWILWRAQVPELWRAVGLRPAAESTLLSSSLTGIIAGLIAAAGGVGYLLSLDALAAHLPMLRETLTEAQTQTHLGQIDGWVLVLLTVVLAPLCEEFIFRGLLFRGLRRDLRVWPAALAAAAVFAVIHPTLGMMPVFGLGVACAIAYERTGWLLAPIATHAVYNAVMVFGSGR